MTSDAINLNLTTQKTELNLFLRHLRQSVYNPTLEQHGLEKKRRRLTPMGAEEIFHSVKLNSWHFFSLHMKTSLLNIFQISLRGNNYVIAHV